MAEVVGPSADDAPSADDGFDLEMLEMVEEVEAPAAAAPADDTLAA